MPAFIRRMFVAPSEIFGLSSGKARSYAVALLALRHEVALAIAASTQPLAHLGHALRTHADALLRDLADGTFHPPGPVTTAERALVEKHLVADPARARLITQRASAAGELVPRVAWPSLGLLCCWFHAGAGAHAGEIDALYGPVPMRSMMYSTTEGVIAIPLTDREPSGVLAVQSHIYEFIPLDPLGQRAGAPLLCDQLEPGQKYSLVMSSGAGLWRYQLLDVVECTGFYGSSRTPLIRFVQKEGNILNLAHDRTSEFHVQKVMAALRAAGMPLGRYCFGPGRGTPPRYRLVVEAATGLEPQSLGAAFEKELIRAHPYYGHQRAAEALEAIEIHLASRERFAEFDHVQASGSAGDQGKPIEFARRAELLDPLLPLSHGSAS
jgi:hypothetical protein